MNHMTKTVMRGIGLVIVIIWLLAILEHYHKTLIEISWMFSPLIFTIAVFFAIYGAFIIIQFDNIFLCSSCKGLFHERDGKKYGILSNVKCEECYKETKK